VGHSSEQVFSLVTDIAIALAASACKSESMSEEWMHPGGCSKHCNFAAKALHCMTVAKKVLAP
jgi:hypothetical protein